MNSLSVTYPRTFVQGKYLAKCERHFESEVLLGNGFPIVVSRSDHKEAGFPEAPQGLLG